MTLAVPYPHRVPAFRRGQTVRLLAGEYERPSPPGGTVTLPADAVGRVDGWRYNSWNGRQPESVVVYVAVPEGRVG